MFLQVCPHRQAFVEALFRKILSEQGEDRRAAYFGLLPDELAADGCYIALY